MLNSVLKSRISSKIHLLSKAKNAYNKSCIGFSMIKMNQIHLQPMRLFVKRSEVDLEENARKLDELNNKYSTSAKDKEHEKKSQTSNKFASMTNILATVATVVISYFLYQGLSEPYERYCEIYNAVSLDDRVQTISKDKLKDEKDSKYKVVTKKLNKLTMTELEDIIIAKLHDFEKNSIYISIKYDENQIKFYNNLSYGLILNSILCLVIVLTSSKNSKNPTNHLLSIQILSCILGIWFILEGSKLLRLGDIRKRSDKIDLIDGSRKPIYVDDYVKIMTHSEFDQFQFALKIEKEIEKAKEMKERAERAEREAREASQRLNNNFIYPNKSNQSSQFSNESSEPKINASQQPNNDSKRVPFKYDDKDTHSKEVKNERDDHSRVLFEEKLSIRERKEIIQNRIDDIDYEINRLEHLKLEKRRRELEEEMKK